MTKVMDAATIKSIIIPLQEAQRRLREFDDSDYATMKALIDAETEVVMKYDGHHNQ